MNPFGFGPNANPLGPELFDAGNITTAGSVTDNGDGTYTLVRPTTTTASIRLPTTIGVHYRSWIVCEAEATEAGNDFRVFDGGAAISVTQTAPKTLIVDYIATQTTIRINVLTDHNSIKLTSWSLRKVLRG